MVNLILKNNKVHDIVQLFIIIKPIAQGLDWPFNKDKLRTLRIKKIFVLKCWKLF
jgi:hypothetical protein